MLLYGHATHSCHSISTGAGASTLSASSAPSPASRTPTPPTPSHSSLLPHPPVRTNTGTSSNSPCSCAWLSRHARHRTLPMLPCPLTPTKSTPTPAYCPSVLSLASWRRLTKSTATVSDRSVRAQKFPTNSACSTSSVTPMPAPAPRRTSESVVSATSKSAAFVLKSLKSAAA